MKRSILSLFALVLFASPACATTITAESVLRLMNERRMERGLAPLQLDERLTLAAGDRMRHMEEDGYWSHESPDGLSPFVWLTTRAYPYRFAAENLAAGFETAEVLVQAWMESPGHRENIIARELEDCGIAIIDGSTTGPASGRSVVVLFGTPRMEAAPKRAAKPVRTTPPATLPQ